jgi:hypothetical protein
MPYVIGCPHCMQRMQMVDDAAGKQFRCPSCKTPFAAPPPSADEWMLLDCIGRALVAKALRPLQQLAPLGEVVCDVAQQAMDEWKRRQPELARRREALEALAQASEDRVRSLVGTVVGDAPPLLRQALIRYLVYIPATIRRSVSGPDLALDEARHLLAFLPQRAPCFRRGGKHPLLDKGLVLEELLGVGGFGEVWKARDLRDPGDSAPPVALKFCLEADASAVLRHEEAVLRQVMKHGGHRGVVRLFKAHLDCNPPCLEYEYVEGEDLGRQMRSWVEAPLAGAFERSLQLMQELVDIVAAAHRLDPPVVHRDLKPANILLQPTPDGPRVRVTDFGIGGLATRQARDQTQTKRSHEAFLLTRLAGAYTPVYASAEQMKGEPPDPRDDVHALGVVWYQLLLGDLAAKPPPDWKRILQERGVSAEVSDLVGRCLRSKKRRLPDAAHLARELVRVAADRRRLVVSAGGEGTHLSIAQALQEALPGAEIRIRPGVYREGVVLGKTVSLLGDGPVDQIIIESGETECVRMATETAVVRGLTLRCAAGQHGKKVFAVHIPVGGLLLEDCDITSDSLACVGIHGKGSTPTLRGCKIHDGKQGGVFVYEEGKGNFERCDIFANKFSGIEIKQGGDPTVRACHIHDGEETGVLVWDRGKGTIERCDIFANKLAGITIRQRSDLTVRDCKITGNGNQAVCATEEARGRIERCDLRGNACGAWYIGPGSLVLDTDNQAE